MNERLLVEAARSPASQALPTAPELRPAARHALAFAAALLVNVALLGTLQWTAANARYAPGGEVVITQLESPVSPQLAKN
jgi:hypothetical protein